jgi:hypothetical protein
VNDSYFSTSTYNSSAWCQLVMCQEVGHVFGLSNQDENFDNVKLNTCMDYTSSPDSNQHPNDHDYAMLEDMYVHLDVFDSWTAVPVDDGSGGGNGSGNNSQTPGLVVGEWGKAISTYGNGRRTFSRLTWAMVTRSSLTFSVLTSFLRYNNDKTGLRLS